MNSRKLLSFAVFAAIVIIGGAIYYAKSSGPQPGDASTKVEIERVMAACGINDQCIMVDTKCNFCCDFVAINVKYEAAYSQLFDKTCGEFSVKHCKSCDDKLDARPKCVSGTCQMVKWGEEPASLNFKTSAPASTPAPIPAPAPVSTPPVSAPVAAPVPAPAQTSVETHVAPVPVTAPIAPVTTPPANPPVVAPAPSSFNNNTNAFGEDEVAPTSPALSADPVDDLYAPITDDMRPYPAQGHVDVIQP